MKAKYQCAFCHKTNTKIKDVYVGGTMFSYGTKVGEEEVIDEDACDFYRCRNSFCGLVYCEDCLRRMDSTRGILFGKHYVCPKCGERVTNIG